MIPIEVPVLVQVIRRVLAFQIRSWSSDSDREAGSEFARTEIVSTGGREHPSASRARKAKA